MDVVEMVMQMEREDGRKEKELIFVENLLRSSDFTDENIASLAEVSLTFVAEVKARLNH